MIFLNTDQKIRSFFSLLASLSLHILLFCTLLYFTNQMTDPLTQISVAYKAANPPLHSLAKKAPTNLNTKSSAQTDSKPPELLAVTTRTREGDGILGSDLGIAANYPRMSRVLGEKGKVTIGIFQQDLTRETRVTESSGYPRLDESALAAATEALKNGAFEKLLTNRPELQVYFIFKLTETE